MWIVKICTKKLFLPVPMVNIYSFSVDVFPLQTKILNKYTLNSIVPNSVVSTTGPIKKKFFQNESKKDRPFSIFFSKFLCITRLIRFKRFSIAKKKKFQWRTLGRNFCVFVRCRPLRIRYFIKYFEKFPMEDPWGETFPNSAQSVY